MSGTRLLVGNQMHYMFNRRKLLLFRAAYRIFVRMKPNKAKSTNKKSERNKPILVFYTPRRLPCDPHVIHKPIPLEEGSLQPQTFNNLRRSTAMQSNGRKRKESHQLSLVGVVRQVSDPKLSPAPLHCFLEPSGNRAVGPGRLDAA